MKPVTFNQLLFHPKSDSLSFFQSPLKELADPSEVELFLNDTLTQLNLQGKIQLKSILESYLSEIRKLIRKHPEKSHGFFISEDLVGHVILDRNVESYCIIGKSFHVRPLLEDLLVNPEFILINVSLYDIKIFRGDFHHLEIIQQYEFDQLPKNFSETGSRLYAPQYLGLIPYKTILAMKTIAGKTQDVIMYHSMPVIVTGLDEMKKIFLRYFEHHYGIISNIPEDFFEKTCAEIFERSKSFRPQIMDFYSAKFVEKIKSMTKSRRLITELGDVISAISKGRVVHLVLPSEKKLWGKIDLETGEYVLHKKMYKNTSTDILNELAEEVMKQGGRIQILGPHFFPKESSVMAILRGHYEF